MSTSPGLAVIVDDDPDMRLLVRLQLQKLGWAVEVHDAGESFWEALQEPGRPLPTVAFIDLRMPKLSGTALLERMASAGLTEKIPVVVLSAHAGPGVADEVIAAGAWRYLSKPFTGSALEALIADLPRREHGCPDAGTCGCDPPMSG